MKPSVAAMADELMLIKQAKKWEPINKAELKQLAKNVAVYGTGIGLGTAGGHILNRTLMPKIFPHTGKGLRKGLIMASGGILGLLGAAAMNKNLRKIREAREEDDQRKRNT